MFVACDESGEMSVAEELTAVYSNKLSDGSRKNLDLSYSGSELLGKEVRFEADDRGNADILLSFVLPHEEEVAIEAVKLQRSDDGRYSFEGNAVSAAGTMFDYRGMAGDGLLELSLDNVSVPGTEPGMLSLVPFAEPVQDGDVPELWHCSRSLFVRSDDADVNRVFEDEGVAAVLSNMLHSVLRDVDFASDGNVTASFRHRDAAEESDYGKSPQNMAFYFMADDTTVYVTPQVDMIVSAMAGNAASKALSIDINAILSAITAYGQLNKWTTTGVKFVLKDNPYGAAGGGMLLAGGDSPQRRLGFEGDKIIYVDNYEIAALVATVNHLFTLFPELPAQIESGLGGLLDVESLLAAIGKANVFEIGLFLNK
jgi:hypothetical protein